MTEPKIAAVERREAGVLRKARGAFYEASNVAQRRSGAPLPHVCEGRKRDGGPHADQTTGAMNHVCCLKIESVKEARNCRLTGLLSSQHHCPAIARLVSSTTSFGVA